MKNRLHRKSRRALSLLLAGIMLLSLLPAGALAAGTTFDVTDYGADPTGIQESSTAVIAALAAAAELPNSTEKTIVFPKGEYHFYADYSEKRELYVSNTLRWNERAYAEKYIGILVENMKNVTIDGGGSLFIFHGNICTIAAIGSENVTFKNFSQDHASPDVVDVTVESHVVGENAAILYIPPCYEYSISGTTINWKGESGPVTGEPYWTNSGNLNNQQRFDTIDGTTARGTGNLPFSNVTRIEELGNGRLKVTYNAADKVPVLGRSFQMRKANPRMTPGAFFLDSKGITVQNANFHFLHGFGMVGQLSEDITLDTVKCQPRPGTGRTSAGFADFIQMSSIAGKVTIKNCEFSNPHDDPINIHGTFLQVKEVSNGNKTFKVRYNHDETWGFPQYNVGDTVEFSDINTLIPATKTVNGEEQILTGVVASVINPGEGEGRSKDNEEDMRTIIITLEEPVEGITANNYVVENVTYTPEVEITGCRFAEVPTRGILVTTRKKVVIEDNYFDRMDSSSIFISCDGNLWRESGRTEDVTIRNNTFICRPTTGDSDLYGGTAVIMIWPTNGTDDANKQIHKKILIENNTFSIIDLTTPVAKSVIAAKSVGELTIKNNLFLRYDPNVSMELAATSNSVTVGGSQATTLTTGGTVITPKVFRLRACKNVVMEGNTYDDGLNLGVQLDGNVVTANDVDDRDGVLTKGGNNQLPAVGAVSYFSSDPSVATVSSSGVVTGVSVGTAEIYAYRMAAGRGFESNHLTFSVANPTVTPPSKIEVEGADTVAVDGSVTLTANVTGSTESVTWAVKPITSGAAATIDQNGVLTATAHGVVEVTASLGGVTGSKIVTVSKPVGGLNEAWSVKYPSDETGWTLNETSGKVTIDAKKGGGDFNDATGARNFLVTKTTVDDFELTVKLNTAACGNGGCYEEAGLIVSLDHNNYVSVVRKNQGNNYWLSIIRNSGGTANEKNITETSGNRGNPVYLKLTKSGNTYTGSYSYDGTSWSQINTQEITLAKPEGGYDVGFFATNHNQSDSKNFEFEQFKIGGVVVPLVSTNVAPTATNVTVAQVGNDMKVTYTYADNENDVETGTLIAWHVSDSETGHYTRVENASGATLAVTEAIGEKWVKAVVVPVDSNGRSGAPVASAAVQAPAQAVDTTDATLRSLSVGGAEVSGFSPTTTAYTVGVPTSTETVNVAAVASQKDATVSGTGSVTLTGDTTTVNIDVTTTGNAATKRYTVTIVRPKSNNVALSALSASAGSGTGITFDPDTRFYQVIANQGAESMTFSLTKDDPNATVAVRFNNVEQGEYASAKTLTLAAGLNNLELRVTAADGISTAIYRVAVMKSASTDVSLKTLTVGGEDLLPGMTDGKTLARPSSDSVAIVAAANDTKATVAISVDGAAVTSGSSVTLTKAKTPAVVRVVAEDGVAEARYEITINKADPADATLYSLDVGGAVLSPAFDPAVTEYTMSTAAGSPVLKVLANQSGAKVSYETYAEYVTDQLGGVTGPVRVFKDQSVENKLVVTVVSPNEANTKIYTVDITPLANEVYLSDLEWVSATSGWSGHPVRRDLDVDGATITLTNADGSSKTYTKGLGTHAQSEIIYNLKGMGYDTLTVDVGVSHSQYSSGNPNLTFDIIGDGTSKAKQAGMQKTDAYVTLNADITGVEVLDLKLSMPGGNGNAHGDWADAKLTGSLLTLAETTITPVELTLDEDEATVYTNAGADHTATLTANVKPAGAAGSVSWSSSAPTVASVENGAVTGLNVGTATITASAGGLTATCDVTVKSTLGGSVVIVQSAPKYDDTLTVNVNGVTPEAARAGLGYQWFRGNDEISGATESTYKVVKADMGETIKVKVTAASGSLYEGDLTSNPTAAVGKKAGPAAPTGLDTEDCSAAGNDGKITGLTAGTAYEIQRDDGEWVDAILTGTEITGLYAGTYLVRVKVDTDVQELGAPSSGYTIAGPDVEAFTVKVESGITGGTVTVSKTLAEEDDKITVTATPDAGYELKSLTVTTESGDEVDMEDGKFTMPAENVTVTAEFEARSYTIHHDLENIECEMHNEDHTICHGETRTMTLTADEGFEMPETAGETGVRVTEDDDDTWHNFTYTRSADKKTATLVIDGTDVVSDLTVSGKGVAIMYHIGHNLTGLNCDLGDEAAHKVGYKAALEITLTPTNTEQFTVPGHITITMGDRELTEGEDYTYEDGVITIAEGIITADLVITAAGVKQPIAMKGVGILGSFKVGSELTARVLPVNGTVTYQWYRVDGETAAPIAGATGDKYTLTDDDLGKQIRVDATGTGDYGGTVSSRITTIVVEADAPTVDVTGMTLNRTEVTLAVGETFTLVPTVTPDDATNTWVYWSSDNEDVATVSRAGELIGVAEGTATITATTADGGFICTCAVTVEPAAAPAPSNNTSRPSKPTTTTTTSKNEDGSTTTTVTNNRTGTVTETTEKEDGTVEVKETLKDGTVTETVTEPDGTVAVTETKPDGTVTETVQNTDGSTEVVETKPDGTVTAATTDPEGGKVEKVTDPEKNVAITVTAPEGEVLAEVKLPAVIPEPETKFEDVPADHWAEKAINTVAGLGLVKGVGDDRYDMTTAMDRGSLATVLYRLSNGKSDYEAGFRDVPTGKYYTEGVAWAAKVGVVTGISADVFAPEQVITREQLAVMLARYAKLMGMDTKADAGALKSFTDSSATGDWAVDGVAWCVKTGILRGKGGNVLDPTADVSRAEVAVMLERFVELMK